MLNQIINLFGTVFNGVFSILTNIFNAVPGLMELFIAFFFIAMAVRFFVIPMTGKTKSDNANKESEGKT